MNAEAHDGCLHAFTECTYPNPAYLNVTRKADGTYVVIVRSREATFSSHIVLSAEQFAEFKVALG